MASKFRVDDKGVFHAEPNKEEQGGIWWRPVCALIEVVAETRNEVGGDWGKLLEWKDREGRHHQWPMPNELLGRQRDSITSALRKGGLRIEPYSDALVTEYIAVQHPARLVRCTNRTGWHGQSYVLPGSTIAPEGAEEIVFQCDDPTDRVNREQGTAEEWRAAIGSYCPGNSRLLVSVSTVLAGPVLRLTGDESGGVHWHGTTSKGKTTLEEVGASISGDGIQQWLATANGIEGMAAKRNDACLLLDELSQVNPHQVQEIGYTLAAGQGKSRANIDGTARPRATWSISIVSTGELTMEAHAKSGGSRMRGGSGVRLLDIPADAGAGMGAFENTNGLRPGEFSDLLKANAKRVYGAPFRQWIECIIADVPLVTEILKGKAATFYAANCPAGASAEVGRAVKRFAVIAAAGELATEFDVTGWSEGDAAWGAKRCLEDWIKQRGGVGGFDAKRMVDTVRAFLREYGDSDRFPRPAPLPRAGLIGSSLAPATDPRRSYKGRAGFHKDGSFVFHTDVFDSEVCAGYDPRQVCAALKDGGFLDAPAGRLKKQHRGISGEQTWWYTVKETILHEAEDAE